MKGRCGAQVVHGEHSVTALDVARAVGVSQSTVSRVLNSKTAGFISAATRDRVLAAAKELGYSPNPLARAFRKGKTQLIGIILREIDDPVFSLLASHLSVRLRGLGYHLILINAQSDPKEALKMKNVLDTRHADGLIIMGDLLNGQAELQQVVSTNRAVVSLFRKPFRGIGLVVTVDSEKGIALVLEHLRGLGHTRVGFLGYDWLDDTELRREAFERLTKAWGMTADPRWIRVGRGGIDGGYETMNEMLSLQPRPTAVVACDDLTAIGAMSAAMDMGVQVPREMSIVGFDDIYLSRCVRPRLTTVRMPVEAISAEACRLLVGLIESKRRPHTRTYRIAPELVVRDSTVAPDLGRGLKAKRRHARISGDWAAPHR